MRLNSPGYAAVRYPTGFTPISAARSGEDEWKTTSLPPRERKARSVAISPFVGDAKPTRNAMRSFASAAGICAGVTTCAATDSPASQRFRWFASDVV